MARAQGPIPRSELTEVQQTNLRVLGKHRDAIFAEMERALERRGLKLFVGQIVFTADEYAAKRMRAEEGCCCCPDGSYRSPCNNCEPVIKAPSGEPGRDTII